MGTGMITVTVVDDHPAIRAGIAQWYSESGLPIKIEASGASSRVAWLPPGTKRMSSCSICNWIPDPRLSASCDDSLMPAAV